jgi:multidrug efflux pump subunit AcrB
VKVIRPVLSEGPAARAGLTRQEIARATERTFDGYTVGLYREGDKLIPIKARAPDLERSDVQNLYQIQVWSMPAGRTIPIQQVVSEFETTFEDAIIGRRNRLPTIIPQCNQVSGNASVVFSRLRPQIEGLLPAMEAAGEIPPGYAMEWGGEYENSNNGQKGLAATFPLMILLMVLIVIVQFNSLRLPAIIWLTVPLAVIGVAGGLLVAGQPFGFMALLGALSLIGMLVKNSIVLVDEINTQDKEGKALFDAIQDASASRLRPVAMAALTTVLGMIPLLPDAFFVSMAVTIMAGLAFATVLTLIVVPTLYGVFFRVKVPK